MSRLAPMRYKNFVWPHNPYTYSIDYERRVAAHPMPGGDCQLESLGQGYRVMRGEGVFVGPEAYRTFQALASIYYENTPGMLVHPVWQAAKVWFVELALAQEPRADYVRYRFTFWECPPPSQEGLKEVPSPQTGTGGAETRAQSGTAAYHIVVKGDTLWDLARQYGLALSRLIALNPQIKNPNLIRVGERIKVSG